MIRPWSDISDHYKEYNYSTTKALCDLSLKIGAGDFNVELFGWTSMLDLCISQQNVSYDDLTNVSFLKISCISKNDLEFRYLDTEIEKKQWSRIYPANQACAALSKFIDQLHWEVKYE